MTTTTTKKQTPGGSAHPDNKNLPIPVKQSAFDFVKEHFGPAVAKQGQRPTVNVPKGATAILDYLQGKDKSQKVVILKRQGHSGQGSTAVQGTMTLLVDYEKIEWNGRQAPAPGQTRGGSKKSNAVSVDSLRKFISAFDAAAHDSRVKLATDLNNEVVTTRAAAAEALGTDSEAAALEAFQKAKTKLADMETVIERIAVKLLREAPEGTYDSRILSLFPKEPAS